MPNLPELPFAITSSQPEVWVRNRGGALVATAPARTDLYLNPGGAEAGDAESMLNAATLLGTPPVGDLQLSARVSVDFQGGQPDKSDIALKSGGSPPAATAASVLPIQIARYQILVDNQGVPLADDAVDPHYVIGLSPQQPAYVATEAGGASWTAVAAGTAVDEPGSDRESGVDVAFPIPRERSLSLGSRELALKELSPSLDGSEGIPGDEERGGVRGEYVPPTGPDLLGQRFVDAFVQKVGSHRHIDELGQNGDCS